MPGEEYQARKRQQTKDKNRDRGKRRRAYKNALRANQQLATVLVSQRLTELGDYYAYRAAVVERQVLRRRHNYVRWLFWWVLWGLAGYGYKPLRTLAWLAVVLFGFAAAFSVIGPQVNYPFTPPIQALAFSATAFLGRGFFSVPGCLCFWLTGLAAIEGFLGLLIEISFIATFTQRYFGR
jgi:hypothetical protein